MGFFIRLWVNTIALLAVVTLVPGIQVDRFQTALIAALVLGLVNAVLRPLIIAFTLPINILSLGLFTLLINGFLFFLVSRLVPGFVVMTFSKAVWGALAFGIFSFILNMLVNPKGDVRARTSDSRTGRSARSRSGVIDIEGHVQAGPDEKKRSGGC